MSCRLLLLFARPCRRLRGRKPLRADAGKRPASHRQGGQPRTDRGAPRLVPGGQHGRDERRHRRRARARAHDVQGHEDRRAGRFLPARRRRRRARERLHRQRLHGVLPAGRTLASRADDAARGRPHGEPRRDPRRVRARDQGGPGGAAPAHGRPSALARVREPDGGGLPGPPLPPAGRRLDDRPRVDDRRRRSRLVRALVCAEQRFPRRRRRRFGGARVRARGDALRRGPHPGAAHAQAPGRAGPGGRPPGGGEGAGGAAVPPDGLQGAGAAGRRQGPRALCARGARRSARRQRIGAAQAPAGPRAADRERGRRELRRVRPRARRPDARRRSRAGADGRRARDGAPGGARRDRERRRDPARARAGEDPVRRQPGLQARLDLRAGPRARHARIRRSLVPRRGPDPRAGARGNGGRGARGRAPLPGRGRAHRRDARPAAHGPPRPRVRPGAGRH